MATQRILIELPFPSEIDRQEVYRIVTAIIDAARDLIDGMGLKPEITLDPDLKAYVADRARIDGRDVGEH